MQNSEIPTPKKINNKKPFFTLTRKNQKGQVAIFVALIFQIVFIFFALLINVGLLVHHKINLQQSTDLAAYYGAMKQAEMLNVISHVNFQIRQAWKLLTWRYRILGTFGMAADHPNPPSISLPIQNLQGPISFGDDAKCGTGVNLNLNDVPAFCLAHVGYGDWKGNDKGTETFCKTSCQRLGSGLPSVVNLIRQVGRFTNGSANVAASIGRTIDLTNKNIEDICQKSTALGAEVLSTFLGSYGNDKNKKMKTIQALFKNLNNEEQKFIDLNGDLVKKGSENTFLNNLTDANRVSINNSFKVLNGTSDDFSAAAECKSELYAEILFKYISFYQLVCEQTKGKDKKNPGSSDFQFVSTVDGSGNLNGIISRQDSGFDKNNFTQQFSLGVEKNPWCMVYYGVRAQSEPKIPFLPLSKIKLSAVSFAKPFGGSVGPRFFKNWGRDVPVSSRSGGSQGDQVDKTLPLRSAGAQGSQASATNVIMNYSNFIGDIKGLSDARYIAKYHRDLIGGNKLGSGDRPNLADWNGEGLSSRARIKNLELSVVAPNQFDLTYYSIEPDFYNNYYKNWKEPNNKFVRELESNTGTSGLVFSKDYGDDNFTVMDQLRIASTEVSKNIDDGGNFAFIPKLPTSLLTGWTFLNLTNSEGYTKFPFDASAVGSTSVSPTGTMLFGTCNDATDVNHDYKSIADPNASPVKPPTPGNCVTGGRTGYSVKIISSEAINGLQGNIGGEGTAGQPIRNKIPESFFNF